VLYGELEEVVILVCVGNIGYSHRWDIISSARERGSGLGRALMARPYPRKEA